MTESSNQKSVNGSNGSLTAVVHDPYPLWHEAVERLLVRSGITVVGKASTPETALALVGEHSPDVFLTEIELAEGALDGVACLRKAVGGSPTLKAIVLSGSDDIDDIEAAFEAGAAAYVVKTSSSEDLEAAVRQAFAHSVYFAGRRTQHQPAPGRGRNGSSHGLTQRELETLRLVSEGKSNAEVARALWVTEQTVKFHLSNVYRKIGVPNRTAAARWAQAHGLGTQLD